MPKPSIGRIVHYTLDESDATVINKRRKDAFAPLAQSLGGDGVRTFAAMNTGAIVHAGNGVQAGDVYPMVITRVWNEGPGTVNGQVLLDGNDTYWATSCTPGDGPGSYAWPTRD